MNLNPQNPALLDRILNQLEHILPRVGVRGYPVPGSEEAQVTAFLRLLNNAALQRLGDDQAGLVRLHRQLVARLFITRQINLSKLAAGLAFCLAGTFRGKATWPRVWLLMTELQQRLAESRRWLANAHCQIGGSNTGTTDLAAIRYAVARVEQISGQTRWLRVQPLQRERLWAWGELAIAYSKRLDVEKTRWTLDKIESIAVHWPDDVELQAICADAWQWLAWSLVYNDEISRLGM